MERIQIQEINSRWVFNVLNIYNFNENGPYQYIFDFLTKKSNQIPGDIIEAGTYRGRMTLALSIFIKLNSVDKRILTFDTFSGFPSYHEKDEQKQFLELLEKGDITQEHFDRIIKLRFLKSGLTNQTITTENISTSGDFSNNSLNEFKNKISILGIDNIDIHAGSFRETMSDENISNKKFCLAFVDCDLYEGYIQTLEYVWPRLETGGIIFLDEYYSLKFPGARIACNEFLADKKNFEIMNVASEEDDFERWIVVKK
jgi:hypothetical protein